MIVQIRFNGKAKMKHIIQTAVASQPRPQHLDSVGLLFVQIAIGQIN